MTKTKDKIKNSNKKLSNTPRFLTFLSSFRPRFSKRQLTLLFIPILVVGIWLFWGLPLDSHLSDSPAVSTKILDRNGKLIYEIFADQRRTPVKIDDLPSYVIKATIAIEDKDFYHHPGFDIAGIVRAAYKTLSNQRLEGGSTLTQQLVKNRILTSERTIKRKIQELTLAVITEAQYSKDEILELYLNQIPYGSTAYGIGAA